MSFSPISRAKLGVAADDPFFDDEAAARMYHEISKMDQDEATVLLQMAAFRVAARDLTKYGDAIEAEYRGVIEKRAERVKSALTRNLVSKGKDPAPYIAYLDEISKAADPITDWDISERVKRQWRDPQGRFRVMTQKIEPSILDKPIREAEARKLGIPKPTRSGSTEKGVKLDSVAAKKFQGDYYQVLSMLKTVQNDPITAKGAVVTLNYSDGDTSQFLTSDGSSKLEEKFAAEKYAEGKRLASVDLSFLREDNPQIDLMAAMGTPGGAFANRTTNYFTAEQTGTDQRLVGYGRQMNERRPSDAYNPADRAYRRLGATASLLSDILPSSAVKTQLALNAAKWAGFNATEVERVVGPSARKVAYRYRGIEKAPNPGLQKTIDSYISGTKGNKDKARDILINGSSVEIATPQGIRSEFKESPIIQYLVKDLPKKELVNLQTKSGAMPPSRGYIIDRNGKIITEAVGYGDDHYLPFNLKNLSRLKGGEYVRTRTLGGPTTEDVYAGLISGARSVTVVSRSGIYTVEFDEAFRGSRRYNDKAARMVGRYGMILDAVKSGNVTLETVPGDRLEELKADAFRLYPDEGSEGYKKELDRLKRAEEANPRMSRARQEETARDFLRTVASRQRTRDGSEMTYEEMVANLINRDVAAQIQEDTAWLGGIQGVKTNTIEANARAMVAAKYKDPEAVINTMGLDDEYNKYFETQIKTYKASQAPLRLDGPGYAFALDAMKEQFPYYIKSVKYRQLNQSDAGSTREDVGYVKPKFTRPAGVSAGYYDTSITGEGKISADKLNYQNLNATRAIESILEAGPAPAGRREAKQEDLDREKQGGYKSPKMGYDDASKKAAKRMRDLLRRRTKTDKRPSGEVAGLPPVDAGSSITGETFRSKFPYTLMMSDTQFEEAWDNNPEVVAKAMEQEIDDLKEFLTFGIDEQLADRRFRNKGEDPVVKYDRNNPPLLEISKGSKFDFDDPLYMPGISSDRILAKLQTAPELVGAKARVAKALEAGRQDPKALETGPTKGTVELLREVVSSQVDVVKMVQRDQQNSGMQMFSPERLDKEINTLEDLVRLWQLSDNYVEQIKSEAEDLQRRKALEATANNQEIIPMIPISAVKDALLQSMGDQKNPNWVVDENGNVVVDMEE